MTKEELDHIETCNHLFHIEQELHFVENRIQATGFSPEILKVIKRLEKRFKLLAYALKKGQ